MKLKEVCSETGLSRKTIRLYEEKGLLSPHKEKRNGREYREYTEEDVRQLQIIALLRRAWFTMEEIRQMLEDPAAIQDIFPQYRQWLLQQKRDLDALIAVAARIEIGKVEDIQQLTEEMAAAAATLPLPQWDIKPRFKYLDEMEKEVRAMRNERKKDDELKTFRQTTLLMDRDRVNDHAITFGQFREMESGQWWGETASVKKEEQLSRSQSVVSFAGGVLLTVGLLGYVVSYLTRMLGFLTTKSAQDGSTLLTGAQPLMVVLFVVGFIMYGGVRGYAAWKERQRWIEKMRRQDLEKQQKREIQGSEEE